MKRYALQLDLEFPSESLWVMSTLHTLPQFIARKEIGSTSCSLDSLHSLQIHYNQGDIDHPIEMHFALGRRHYYVLTNGKGKKKKDAPKQNKTKQRYINNK
jgi:hypothetical protein